MYCMSRLLFEMNETKVFLKKFINERIRKLFHFLPVFYRPDCVSHESVKEFRKMAILEIKKLVSFDKRALKTQMMPFQENI